MDLIELAKTKMESATVISETVDVAGLNDVTAISQLIQLNFLMHPDYQTMSEHVRADYLRANSVNELHNAVSKPKTIALVVRTAFGVSSVLIARLTLPDELSVRLDSLNGLLPKIDISQKTALDIRRLHTAQHFQKRGYAGQLLNQIEKAAQETGSAFIISDATAPAQGFFERHGFSGKLISSGRQNGSFCEIFRCYKLLQQI